MTFTPNELARLAADHQRYLDRITPAIWARLTSRGCSADQIARYLSELPADHPAVTLNAIWHAERKAEER